MTNTPNKTVKAMARSMWDYHRKRFPNDPLIRGEFRSDEDNLDFLYSRWEGYAQAAYDTVIERLMEPTPEMLNAGYAAYTFGAADTIKMVRSIHKAMLTASKGANDA